MPRNASLSIYLSSYLTRDLLLGGGEDDGEADLLPILVPVHLHVGHTIECLYVCVSCVSAAGSKQAMHANAHTHISKK